MSSSDETPDVGQLLSKFQSFRPNSSQSANANANTNHEFPRRRGRPKKVIPIIDLIDSDDNNLQSANVAQKIRHHRHGSSFHSANDVLRTPRSQQNQMRRETSHGSLPRITTKSSSSSMDVISQMDGAADGTRSRRSRARIGNYYSNANYSGYISTSDDEEERGHETHTKRNVQSSRMLPQSPLPKAKEKRRRFRLIYDLHGIRICRHLFSSLEDIPSLPDKVPYSPEGKSSNYAQRFKNNPQASLLHVCFSHDEVLAMIGLLSPCGVGSDISEMSLADQVIHIVQRIHKGRDRPLAKRISKMGRLQKMLTNQGFDSLNAYHQAAVSSNSRIDAQYHEIFTEKDTKASEYLKMAATLRRRQKADIRAFIKDARVGNLPTRPFYITATKDLVPLPDRCDRDTILQRFPRQLPKGYSLRRTHTWKGASNDVINLAWSPDGSKFAIGAAAQCDVHNMQYNRSNNLILGDFMHHSIKELPDHRIPYPAVNPNNTHLYMSVSAVQWFNDTLYTSSYDKTVKIWDVATYEDAACVRTLRHDSRVQVMARSHVNPGLLATGTDSTLHLWHFDEFNETCHSLDFLKQRSIKNPRMAKDIDLLPASLAWGSCAETQNLLVAGFAGRGNHESDACREGLLAMWRMTESSIEPLQLQPNAQNTFDVKFHPILPWVATGTSVPSMGTNGAGRGVRSLVRIYEPLQKARCAVELNCPALDMNDVSFCPADRFYISASCTDGVTYVWDIRNPSHILHKLHHGDALNQLDEQLTREQADVGVRVALWSDNVENFITGGSDGVLKSWNILLAPEDVHERDIVTFEDEIMSGSFSPDKSTMLVGDAAGGIHVLQPGIESDSVEELRYDQGSDSLSGAPSDSGRAIGEMLLKTGQLIQHPRWGIGQGPAYRGPYASWARPEGTPDDKIAVTPLLKEIQALQLDQPDPESHGIDTMASRVAVDMQRKVAEIRNRDPGVRKRKKHDQEVFNRKDQPIDIIDLCSDDDDQPKRQVWIDLTNEPDSESVSVEVNEDADVDMDVDDSDFDSEDYWFPESCAVDPNIRHSE